MLAVLGLVSLPVTSAAQSLSYTVSWLGIPVVDVDITTVKQDSNHQVIYRAKTRPLFDPLYSVDNSYSVLLEPQTGQLLYYEKEILERKKYDHLWARYDRSSHRILYSNGLERSWQEGNHNLFSALQWVQQHHWQLNEKQQLVIESEGIFWEVGLVCTEMKSTQQSDDSQVEVQAIFEKKLAGEPVLSSTDILTLVLPGEGNILRMGLNPSRTIVSWIEWGTSPFHVRAELNAGSDQHFSD
ncbi:MAG: DUF3108 domain-containing protein [Fidelibacterota bacterium]|nr:MAG: DUF3108 domain-containing protein [Candidatus Neomarinimicrobiota bacterium]